ncbi:MAG: hypothetical protein E3J21_05440 [Anaerolineales bacterium]|nr:MAG: hypothetical protein E3J21_05440 [Anaerolineales bacterium]
MRYTIRRISLAPLAKFGCLLGTLVSLLPSLLCSLSALRLLVLARRWLEGWQEGEIEILGFTATLDFIELLGLEPVLEFLQAIGPMPWTFFILAIVVVSVASGLLVALTIYVTGLGYNFLAWLTGGLEVELKEVRTPGPRRQA